MKIEAFVFDFDGTLAELRLDFLEMKRQLSSLAESCLAPPPPAPFLPVLEWIAWLTESIQQSNGGQDNGFMPLAHALVREMELQTANSGSLFPFTRPLLRALKEKGVKVAIITRNCDSAVRVVFPDISDYCCAFLPRDRVLSPKPDPAHLLCALESIGADPHCAIMVGDHPLDIETGKVAGVMTAGVCSGSSSREELLRAGCDLVAEDCAELVEVMTKGGFMDHREAYEN